MIFFLVAFGIIKILTHYILLQINENLFLIKEYGFYILIEISMNKHEKDKGEKEKERKEYN